MPFVDIKDDVFLGEESFATWHEALDHYETLPRTRILPGHGAPGGKELFAQRREYLTAAKKEYLPQRHSPGSGPNQPSPKDPGGIDESIDLSRDR